MTRLFILFYLGVLAVLVAAWSIHGAVARWQFGGEFKRVVEGTHRGGARLIVDQVNNADETEWSETIEKLQPQFDYPLEITSLPELPQDVQDQIESGSELVYFRVGGRGDFVAAPLKAANEAVCLGPFPRYAHYEDSLAGGMRLAVNELKCVSENQQQSVLAKLQKDFGYSVQITKYGELPEDEQWRLAAGEDIVFFVRDEKAFVASSLTPGVNVIQFGPFPSFEGSQQRVFATTLALILVVAAIAIAVLLRPIARQLRYVENAAHAIADGDLSARVDEGRVSSAKPLALAFNDMATRTESMIRTQRELLQAVSHELRTPLSRMRFAIDLIDSAASKEEQQQRLASLDAATEELDELVGELLQYVRMESSGGESEREVISLKDALVPLVQNQAAVSPAISYEIDDSIKHHSDLLNADLGAFQRALSNLLTNAGRFAISSVRITAEKSGDHVFLNVDDDGPGIAVEDRERVLEPFVRLDDGNPGGGVGLGLALVKRIVAQHNGIIEVHSSPSGGCRIRTRWDLAPESRL